MEAISFDQHSRAVYIFPAMLLVAGLVFVASRSDTRSSGNRPLSPHELPLSQPRSPFATAFTPPVNKTPDEIKAGGNDVVAADAAKTLREVAQREAFATNERPRLERMPPPPMEAAPVGDDTVAFPNYAPAPASVAPQAANAVDPAPRGEIARARNRRSMVANSAKPVVRAEPSSPEAVRAAFEQGSRLIERGKRLAEKQAHRSAAAEFRQALTIVAETLDRRDQGQRRVALQQALVAFEEADELFAMSKRVEAVNLTSLVLAHDTPLLRGKDCSQLSLRAAMEMYFEFAEKQLVHALREVPSSANALFYLGKLHMSQTQPSGGSLAGPKSIACLQAAVRIQPDHHHAANELGVLLARYGQWNTAKAALLRSLRAEPTIEAWSNLAKVHQHLNEPNLAGLAAQEATSLASVRQYQFPNRASRDINQMVTWVPPSEFNRAALATTPVANAPVAAPPLNPSPVATPNQSGAQFIQASSPSSLRSPWRQPRGQ